MYDSKPVSETGRLLAAGCGALLAATGVQAQDQLPSEHDYYGQLPVVLTATRLEQNLADTPLPVTVIDREMIEASGARDIEEVLRLVPGMIVGHHDGHTGFATYHAIADRYARRMQILVDGRSVFTPTFGGVDWSSLPITIENIQRIEVVRSPNAATQGANSLLGTISIITRQPEDSPGTEISLAGGQNEIYKVQAHRAGSTDAFAYQINASSWGDAGFDQPAGYADDRDITVGNLQLEFRPDADTRLSLQAGAGRETALTSQPQDLITEPPHDEITRRQYQQLLYRRRYIDGSFEARLYHTAEDQQESFLSLPIPAYGGIRAYRDRSISSSRYDLEVSWNLQNSRTLRTVWGAAVRRDSVYSPSYFSTAEEIDYSRYRAFGQGEWHITPDWLLNAGLMFESSELSGDDLSPHLALNYFLDRQHSFRFGISSATRTPVLIETRANQRFAIGPDYNQEFATSGSLDAERIRAVDLGYIGQYLEGSLTLDARLFHDRIRDLITYYVRPYPGDAINGYAFDFRNRDRLEIDGFESQLQYRPGPSTRIVFNYAYVHLDSTDIDEQYSVSGPRHNASLLAMQDLGWQLRGSLGFYYLSDYDGIDTGTPIPVTRRVDLRLARPFRLGGVRGEAALTIQGALGGYTDFRRINEFDRQAYLKVRLWF